MKRVLLVVAIALGCRTPAPSFPAEPADVVAARKAVVADPADADARDALGEVLLLHGFLDEAERVFAGPPVFATGHHGIAMVRFHRGDAAGGIAALRDGLALVPTPDPTYARTRLLEALAWAHVAGGRDASARAAIEESVTAQGLEVAVAAHVARLGRARLHLHAKRWTEAIAEVTAARATRDAPAFVVRAALVVETLAHAQRGDIARAEATFAMLPPDERHPTLLEARAAIAIAKHDFTAAATLVDTLEPEDPYAAEAASLSLGLALHDAGRPEAVPRLRRIVERRLRSVPSVLARRTAAARLTPHAREAVGEAAAARELAASARSTSVW